MLSLYPTYDFQNLRSIGNECIIKKLLAKKYKLVLNLEILTGQDLLESQNCTYSMRYL